jgi:DNA-binding GntR family transcriptional regulator
MSKTVQKAKPRAGAAVYDTIREMAIEYRFRPGEKIIENDLAAVLGVSRTPVREALNRLVNEGLIQFERNHGFSCRTLSAEDVFFLAEARRDIELTMLPKVIARAREDELSSLKSYCVSILDTVAVLPPCELAKADEAFHNRLSDFTRNTVTASIVRNISARIRFIRKIQIEGQRERSDVFNRYIQLTEALLQRDEKTAVEIMAHVLRFDQSDAEAVLKEGLGRIYLDKINFDVSMAP